MHYQGQLIYRERIRRNWSQEGLCKGICTISYLSKIENGKTVPSQEILNLLLQRLELTCNSSLEEEAARRAEEAYEHLLSLSDADLHQCLADHPAEKYRATRAGLDFLLLEQFDGGFLPLPETLEICMDARQLALQRILQERSQEAVALFPHPFCYYYAGNQACRDGRYAAAMADLQKGYDLAAGMGAPRLMLYCRVMLGNCYSNQNQMEDMLAHYQAARRLASALKEIQLIGHIDYNIASTRLSLGQYEKAYDYLSQATKKDIMLLHKLAICCEKMGRKEEALQALDQAEHAPADYPDEHHCRLMLSLVRFRLLHPDYLARDEYGEMLLHCFQRCREELPMGYAAFHLPWMQEWYAATRQYKKAYELLIDFPNTSILK